MPITPILDQLRADRAFMRNVAAWERIPARAARYAPPPATLDARLLSALHYFGIEQLYTHQAQAIEWAGLRRQSRRPEYLDHCRSSCTPGVPARGVEELNRQAQRRLL